MGYAQAVATRTAQHAPTPAVRPHRPEASAPGPAPRRPVHELSRVAAQRALSGPGNLVDAVPRSVHEVLRAPGRPLDAGVRADMQARFAYDFGDVRIHTDTRAATSAAEVRAKAYTVGRHIAFGAGQYRPSDHAGCRTLAHELAHVVQQAGTTAEPAAGLTVSSPSDNSEREAESASRAGTAVTTVRPRLTLQRECVDGRWKYVYDGCSVPAWAAGILTGQRGAFDKDNPAGGRDTQFARGLPTTEGGVACDRHDECYQSCVTERDACDSRMYADMKQICAQSKESADVKATCYEWATLYYKGLRLWAEGAFQQRKRQVCGCDKDLVPAAMSNPPLSLLTHRSGARKGQHLTWLEYTIMSTLPPLSAYQPFANSAQYEEYVRPTDPSRGETR